MPDREGQATRRYLLTATVAAPLAWAARPVLGVASEAGAKTLMLSHFVSGGTPVIPDQVRFDAVRLYFPDA